MWYSSDNASYFLVINVWLIESNCVFFVVWDDCIENLPLNFISPELFTTFVPYILSTVINWRWRLFSFSLSIQLAIWAPYTVMDFLLLLISNYLRQWEVILILISSSKRWKDRSNIHRCSERLSSILEELWLKKRRISSFVSLSSWSIS